MRFHIRGLLLHVIYHCDACNRDEDVTALVDALCQYGENDCPSELYYAWKIFRLGTDEYKQRGPEYEHTQVKLANKVIAAKLS